MGCDQESTGKGVLECANEDKSKRWIDSGGRRRGKSRGLLRLLASRAVLLGSDGEHGKGVGISLVRMMAANHGIPGKKASTGIKNGNLQNSLERIIMYSKA